jgi:hypothetical protein
MDNRLKQMEIERKTHLLNQVNSFILIGVNGDGILGLACFEAMCAAIKQAYTQAQAFKQANPSSTSEETQFWYYLPTNWKLLLKSIFFQQLYAAFLMYYYYDTYTSSSETVLDGDINHNRGGAANNGDGSQNITSNDTQKKGAVQKGIAYAYLKSFKVNFWERNKTLFAGCGVEKNCEIECTTNTHQQKNIRTILPTVR